ncbi:MAG TPA: copper-binding protein [Methylomirabilota bacterium]|nr:copper-binding protein [Methylomirabilota bacterium]
MCRFSSVAFMAQASICAWLLVGCRERAEKFPAGSAASSDTVVSAPNTTIQTAPTNNIRSFSTRGVIRDFSGRGKSLLIRHEDIPGYMPPMTMEFEVRNTNELRGLQIGDTITFQVIATEDDSWIEGLKRISTNDVPQAAAPADPTAASILRASQLKPGELLPDAELLSENGRAIKLSEFEGQALAFTFIFTRCPLPTFCPRMNQNFFRAREILLKESGPTNWHFLSVSFDPDFDKPGVLSRYAWSYRGENSNRWLFASAATNVVAGMSPLLDFRFANEGGSFQHNLRTVLLDPHRRVFKHFEGNSWNANELAQAMREAARAKQ